MTTTAPSLGNFLHDAYQRHNRRRQEHLASLCLPIAGRTVLEVGAGIGDHTSFFLDRGCPVTVTDAREDNLAAVRLRHPSATVRRLDLDERSEAPRVDPHQVVYAYGILYHLADPEGALAALAGLTKQLLLLETCVSFGNGEHVNPVDEDTSDPTQSATGRGCRPTRGWVFANLRRHFPFVYLTRSQPWHEEFPVDWTGEPPANVTGLHRSVFVASRSPLPETRLSPVLLDRQLRE